MIAGRDFPDFFARDLFALRRGGTQGRTDEHNDTGLFFTAGNPWNPESLLIGSELEAGLYGPRNWPDYDTYQRAVRGELTVDETLRVAPRTALRSIQWPVCLTGYPCQNSADAVRWRDELTVWRAARGHDR